MARVTVEDCLENVENRFELVMLATKRARHLALSGQDPLVPIENDKPTVLALREIAEGLITREVIERMEKSHQHEPGLKLLSPESSPATAASMDAAANALFIDNIADDPMPTLDEAVSDSLAAIAMATPEADEYNITELSSIEIASETVLTPSTESDINKSSDDE